VTGTAIAGGFQYGFGAGFIGMPVLSVPIPSDATPGSVQVEATATCTDGTQGSGQLSFDVVPAQPIPFTGHLALSSHDVLIRRAVLPPATGSTVHDVVTVSTTAGDLVTLSATVVSGSIGSLGTSADGGTAYHSGDIFYTAMATADAGGSAIFSLPLSSSLLTPGKGAVVRLAITCASGSAATVYRSSFPIREVALRLVLQPASTSRGGNRLPFVLGRSVAGSSHLHVLVLADPGAHIDGSAAFGTTVISAQAAPVTAGPGGRVLLSFVVPNALAPPAHTHGDALLTVTSSFRNAQVVRRATIVFGGP
jgi:hypothetical protein